MQLPEKHEAEITAEKNENRRSNEDRFSRFEKAVIICSLGMVITVLICGAWSGILIMAGAVEGGGPVGLLMKVLPVHLLLR
ncbi:MAG TPA: hypothetical protein VJ969_04585 [Desulfopila sp.]|nr:hypothetical protein [Desulfopila sp.]